MLTSWKKLTFFNFFSQNFLCARTSNNIKLCAVTGDVIHCITTVIIISDVIISSHCHLRYMLLCNTDTAVSKLKNYLALKLEILVNFFSVNN